MVVARFADQHRRDRGRLNAEPRAELERTRDRLVEEERLAAVGRLSAAIAHEIRNPVAMIAELGQQLRRRRPGSRTGRPARQEMRRIVLGGQRLERLYHGLPGLRPAP